MLHANIMGWPQQQQYSKQPHPARYARQHPVLTISIHTYGERNTKKEYRVYFPSRVEVRDNRAARQPFSAGTIQHQYSTETKTNGTFPGFLPAGESCSVSFEGASL